MQYLMSSFSIYLELNLYLQKYILYQVDSGSGYLFFLTVLHGIS